jgi:tetratricopeptide (TPR) repeat protein
VFERAGRGEEALTAYRLAVSLNPSDLNARGRLASVAMAMKQHDLAEPHLRFLLERSYQPSRTHLALGNLAEARGDLKGAAVEYRRALTLEPGLTAAKDALSRLGKH